MLSGVEYGKIEHGKSSISSCLECVLFSSVRDTFCVYLKELSYYILKDFRNAPPAKMLIYCQNVIF